MSAATNDSLLEALAGDGWPLGDEVFIAAGAGTTQAAGLAFRSSAMRVIGNGTANASMTLKSLVSNDAPGIFWLINESANNIAVFPFSGEKMNTVANAAFSVTAGNAAVFVPTPPQIKRKGGTSGGGSLNWAASLIS
jgi:hypothetical protein